MRKKLFELFENNEDLFNATIEELDSYNGYLNNSRYYEMELLTEFYSGVDPVELLNRAFFGYDLDTWSTDNRGGKIYGAFNPNRDYFKYNGYGNLVSTNYKDYSTFLDDYFIDNLIENADHLYLDEQVTEIIKGGDKE